MWDAHAGANLVAGIGGIQSKVGAMMMAGVKRHLELYSYHHLMKTVVSNIYSKYYTAYQLSQLVNFPVTQLDLMQHECRGSHRSPRRTDS